MPRPIAAALTGLAALAVCCALMGDDAPSPPAGATPQHQLSFGGQTYHVFADGHAYQRRGGAWRHVARIYDPAWRGRLIERDGARFKRGPDGKEYRMARSFACDFDGYADVRALVGVGEGKAGFTTLTLQSPSTPTVRDYVKLRKRILLEGADFVDTRVEPSTRVARSGGALRCSSRPPSRGMVCSKASISTELVDFRAGDTVWYRAWYYLEPSDCGFTTLVDLEATAFDQHNGIRLALRGGKHLACELKFADKPTWSQTRGAEIDFPRGRWVRVDWAVALSAERVGGGAGRVRIWQDGKLIVDGRGQTLPLPDALCDSLEVGLSAIAGSEAAVLYVDDLAISAERLPDSPK